jgi:ankyrin repeat protein
MQKWWNMFFYEPTRYIPKIRGDPNQRAIGGVTALHMMAARGHVDAAHVLLQNDDIIPIKNKTGPLLLAAKSGQKSMVSLLQATLRTSTPYCSNTPKKARVC